MLFGESRGWDTDSEFITEKTIDLYKAVRYRKKNTANLKTGEITWDFPKRFWGEIGNLRNQCGRIPDQTTIWDFSVGAFSRCNLQRLHRCVIENLVNGINGTVWEPTMFWFLCWNSYFCNPWQSHHPQTPLTILTCINRRKRSPCSSACWQTPKPSITDSAGTLVTGNKWNKWITENAPDENGVTHPFPKLTKQIIQYRKTPPPAIHMIREQIANNNVELDACFAKLSGFLIKQKNCPKLWLFPPSPFYMTSGGYQLVQTCAVPFWNSDFKRYEKLK